MWALLLPITLLVLTSAYEAMDTRAVYVTAVETDLTFAPGTVDVAVGPTSAFISAGGMLPGDATTAPLEVRNTGTLEFAYTLLSSATNPDGRSLASQLGVTIKTGVSDCSAAGFTSTGTVVYDGPVVSVADGTTETALFGDRAEGAETGERALAPGASETLCFQLRLLPTATSGVANASTMLTFVVYAEQKD